MAEVARDLMAAWRAEPELQDESALAPRSPAGWTSWNEMSPEREVCELGAQLVRLVRPSLVVESGVGQGFMTRRLVQALPAGSRYVGFESLPRLREQIRALELFDGDRAAVGAEETPPADLLAEAEVTVLDADFTLRFDEVTRWHEHARPGAFVLIHDTGTWHPDWTPHRRLRQHIADLGIRGLDLPNPRGAFLGQQG